MIRVQCCVLGLCLVGLVSQTLEAQLISLDRNGLLTIDITNPPGSGKYTWTFTNDDKKGVCTVTFVQSKYRTDYFKYPPPSDFEYETFRWPYTAPHPEPDPTNYFPTSAKFLEVKTVRRFQSKNVKSITFIGGDTNDSFYQKDWNGYSVNRPMKLMTGEGDSNYLWASNGDDELIGGSDSDSLYGGGGNDVLYGGRGTDFLEGESGRDSLFGGVGDRDYLLGGYSILNYSEADGSFEVYEDEAGDRLYVCEEDIPLKLESRDAVINLKNDASDTGDASKYSIRNWLDKEVRALDQGFGALHDLAVNTRLLKMANGRPITLFRSDKYTIKAEGGGAAAITLYDAKGVPTGEVVFAHNTFYGLSEFISGKVDASNVGSVVVHEMAHQWHTSHVLARPLGALRKSYGVREVVKNNESVIERFSDGFASRSDWKIETRGGESLMSHNNKFFPTAYAKTGVAEDFAECLRIFAKGTEAQRRSIGAKASDIQKFIVEVFALDDY
jgi:RTX calcium-binding nonapeptide repeat (4 copies)